MMRRTTDRLAATLLALFLTLAHAANAAAQGVGAGQSGIGAGAINMAVRATGGNGSPGSPYTGWTSALDLSASDVAYYFPARVFSFSAPLVFTGERVKIRCEPGAVLRFTGAGVALTSDGGAVKGDVNGVDIIDCKLVGNAAATIGVLLRSSHRGRYVLEITDFSAAGLKTQFAVGSDFDIKVSRHSSEPFKVTPVNGIVFDRRGAGEGNHAGNVKAIIEWVSGDGIVCHWCDSMVFHAGTSEGNGGRGRYFGPNTNQNTVIGGDDEANGGDDLTDEGTSNQFINYMTNKAGGTGVARFRGKRAVISGGRYDTVIIEAGAADTEVRGTPSYNLSGAGTINDSSTSTRWHSKFHNSTTGGYFIPNFDLPLAGAWANAGGSWAAVGYYKRGDLVFLRGCAAGGSGTITTLPTGARPSTDRGYGVRTGATPAPGTVTVSSGGAVVFASGSNSLVCLDGISFELP